MHLSKRIIEGTNLKPTTSFRDIVEQADNLYAGRQEIANVEKSVELLEGATSEAFEVAWRLSRAKFFLGQENESFARDFHREGIEAARRAVRERPERVEGHFWLGVNLALLAQRESAFKAVSHALQAKRALQRACEIDAAHHSAGPLRVLARLQHRLPRVLGGGWQKSLENFQKAIAIAPGNSVTHIYFAELLLEKGEADQARAHLEAVLNLPFDPEWAFEIERDKKLARERISYLKKGQWH